MKLLKKRPMMFYINNSNKYCLTLFLVLNRQSGLFEYVFNFE